MGEEEIESLDNELDPRIRCYVQRLIASQKRLSLLDEKITICYLNKTDTKANDIEFVQQNRLVDSFRIIIPYAQQLLKWEVLFDLSSPKEPPDFIFDSVDHDFHPPLEQLNSFICWDWKDSESLVALVAELLEQYCLHHIRIGETNEVLERHIASIFKASNQDVQIVCNRKERGLGTINILSKLNVDSSRIPLYGAHVNTDDFWALLYVCLPEPDSSTIHSQMYISPELESVLGGCNLLAIPSFQPGSLVGDYFKVVNQLLEKQIETLSESLSKRKDYISAFLQQFGNSVLQYDTENFQSVTLLLAWNDFFFTFEADLPRYFPTEQPVFTFKSVYHCHRGKPYTEVHKDFPYSPRWAGTEMVNRAKAYILDSIKDFQMASVKNADM